MSKKLKTLKKWNKLGFKVKKGSKASAYTKKGKALFHVNQVECRFDFYWSDSYINMLGNDTVSLNLNPEDYENPDRFMPAQYVD